MELVVGGRRDRQWGPVLLVGMGGIWIEVLKDVRTLPIDSTPEHILEELSRLKCARLFGGYRGSPAMDLAAVAQVATAVGQLMAIAPQVAEIDVNPLVVLPWGRGGGGLGRPDGRKRLIKGGALAVGRIAGQLPCIDATTEPLR